MYIKISLCGTNFDKLFSPPNSTRILIIIFAFVLYLVCTYLCLQLILSNKFQN